MTKTEVENFMNRIKSYYDTFTWDIFKLLEWKEKLKPYDSEDVNRKFEEHLNGELKDKPPMLHYLIKYLKTPEEKTKKSSDCVICCNLCSKEMSLSTYNNKHYSRCLSTKYIINQLKKQGKEVSYEELQELSDEVFERVYLKYSDLDMQKLKKKVGGCK